MSIFADIQSIRRGKKIAAIDIARVIAFEAEHELLHKKNDNYNCHPASAAFYASLTQPGEITDLIAQGAYLRDINAYNEEQKRIAAENADPDEPRFPSLNFIPIIMEPGDTPEDMIARAKAAFEANADFERVVSETDAPTTDNPSDTDQSKEGN